MGKLRVWWIPQVPMDPFYQEVNSVEEGTLLLETLAKYDAFQYENKIKPDYCNTGGLQEFDEKDKNWCDWYDEELDIDDPVDFVKIKRSFSEDPYVFSDSRIENVCLSYRHDYGISSETVKRTMRLSAKDWYEAWSKTFGI